MSRRLTPLLVLALAAPVRAADPISPALLSAVSREYSGEGAQEATSRITRYHRIQGSPMMASVATEVVLAKLRELDVEARIEQFPSDGATRYGTFLSPMGWEAREAELWVTGAADAAFQPERLCRFSDVPMCLSTYSKGGLFSGELVDVGPGTADADYAGKDVKGKVVLATGYAGDVVRQAAVKRGAVGAVIGPTPFDRPEHPDMVRYNGIWPRADEMERTAAGFQVSLRQMARLQALMAKGPVTVRGTVDATLAPGKLTLVHAVFPGSEEAEREVVVMAHLDHPKWSANDNASGAGALLEMARTVRALLAARKIAPLRRTLHLVWVPEYYGTMAWVSAHPEVRRCGGWDDARVASPRGSAAGGACVLAALNLDMVGEDTVKTGSRFYATRTPDSVPSFLDALLASAMETTRRANLVAVSGTRNLWTPWIAPYMPGSDHDVLLGLGIPATMLGHDPDWTHHTSEDTVEKTDATELRRVGTMATGAALFLATAGPAEWEALAPLVTADALAREAARAAREKNAATEAGRRRAARAMAEVQRLSAALAAPPAGPIRPELLGTRLVEAAAGAAGARRLVLLPLDRPFEQLEPKDAAVLRAESDRLFGPGGDEDYGTFAVFLFELVNALDGRRGAQELADLLSAEFTRDVDAASVERILEALARAKLVALPGP